MLQLKNEQIILFESAGNKKIVLGLMSGTSLDGLDMALCRFDAVAGKYSYEIIAATTVNYSGAWKQELANVKNASAQDYFNLNARYGKFIAEEIHTFLKTLSLVPDLIASHGHTVFHQPESGFSTQLGCGAAIAAKTGITTVNDFRSVDVALGGQGAPLVPIGDRCLFGEYEACLNIGGFANISFDTADGKRIAYDICEANMLLNLLSEGLGKPFDNNGEMAKTGTVNQEWLKKLNNNPYYFERKAKSLGREWFEKEIEPFIKGKDCTTDLLATATQHVADIIADDLNHFRLKSCLVTGGGAFNRHLIDSIRLKTNCKLLIPDARLVNFKEALIFAFLGYLRVHEQTNTLHSVTGAFRDSIGAAVYLGKTTV